MTAAHQTIRQVVLCMLLTAVMLVGCKTTPKGDARTAPESAAPTPRDANVLVIGTSASAPPMVFRQDDDKLAGLEIDLAHELAKRLNLTPRIVSMFFPNLPYELAERRIDIIMAGLSITDERRLEMAFAKPFLQTGQQAMIHRDDTERFKSVRDMRAVGTRIGAEKSSTGYSYAVKTFGHAAVIEYATLADAAQALRQRQVDIVFHDHPSVVWLVKHDRADMLRAVPGLHTDESIAWAVKPDNRALLAQVNAALDQMRADGTLQRLIDKWIQQN
jgi:polar amino acid transport system substrate-binding protein